MIVDAKLPVLLFADRLPPLTGGMEMHARYFIEHFSRHPRFPLVGVVSRSGDRDCLIADGMSRPAELDAVPARIGSAPAIVFFNSGRWIEDLDRIRRLFPGALFVYRTGGNEILKAPLERAPLPAHSDRRTFWVRQITANIDVLVTNSAFTERRLTEAGLAPALFLRCVGGVNAEAIRLSLPCEPREEPPVFVSVARFVPYKNHALLLEAFAAVARRGHAFRLRLAGDGPLLEDAQRRSQRHGLGGHVEFLGSLANEDACREIARADFYVQLSSDQHTPVPGGSYVHSEGMGRAVLEAITAGTFVIASRSGALPEIVTPERGILVEQGSAEAVASCICGLVSARPARAPFSDAYAWQHCFAAYERLWEERCAR